MPGVGYTRGDVGEVYECPVMTPRGRVTARLWVLLWLAWVALILQQVAFEVRFGAPLQLLVIQVLPLVVFMPGVARDNLRSIIWLTFVLLGYFVWAVLAAFARPGDGLALAGLAVLSTLFMLCALYIRYRGRELKLEIKPDVSEDE